MEGLELSLQETLIILRVAVWGCSPEIGIFPNEGKVYRDHGHDERLQKMSFSLWPSLDLG